MQGELEKKTKIFRLCNSLIINQISVHMWVWYIIMVVHMYIGSSVCSGSAIQWREFGQLREGKKLPFLRAEKLGVDGTPALGGGRRERIMGRGRNCHAHRCSSIMDTHCRMEGSTQCMYWPHTC